ncbi:MAG: triose-phosphate isomerase [Firmicutes bacterium]|nr:triose-phosphate isomerase [Bacillota bacterium]MBQ2311337.1 triose-phosphate isomerase [Bacillota bacterium]MBQ3930748.1 triose-phosphate isomerase [Bacillota bacterium]
MRKPFIAGNWKMYKTAEQAKAFAEEFRKLYKPSDVRVAIAAPFTQLWALKEAFAGSGIAVAAQNMHWADEGAYTGEVSAAMLKEIGVDYCVIGHSERRQYFAETDETVNKKVLKALEAGIMPILCCGESLQTRDAGEQNAFVEAQIRADFAGVSPEDAKKVTVAYEPIWAIGTGRTASPRQAQDMCAYIREVLADIYGEDISEEITIQYGGSVKPANASELMDQPDIDGALVGGASLKPADFIEIVHF